MNTFYGINPSLFISRPFMYWHCPVVRVAHVSKQIDPSPPFSSRALLLLQKGLIFRGFSVSR
jgi:hypothetical protein